MAKIFRIISIYVVFFYACAQGELLKKPQTKEIHHYLSQFEEALQIAAKNHVTKPAYQDLVNNAISGMLKSLDQHSCYIVGDEVDTLMDDLSGSFGGIGIEINLEEDGSIKIISPIEDLPAEKAGIKSGDRIVLIDGIKTKELGFIKSVRKLRGKPGTKVNVTVERTAVKTPLSYDIVRVVIKTYPVKSQIDRDVGYVKMARFSSKSAQELEQIVENWVKERKKLVGIILDLRNNPGGSLDQAVAVSEYFLENGEVVGIKSKDGNIRMIQVGLYGKKAPKLPLIVLVNQGSASASEIVASALQDNKRAVIVGTNSFGKGTVQNLIKTTKNDAMIKITTATYCSPKGKFIDKKGVVPDILVEQKKAPDQTYQSATREAKKTPGVLIQTDDIQYQKAHELLCNTEDYFKIISKSVEKSDELPIKSTKTF